MIIKIGDLFDSKCETIVNTVNCVGVMGKGIALEFKKKYPEMFEQYQSLCKEGKVQPGIPYVYQTAKGRKILNFPTKGHWRSPSQISFISDGLDWFIEHYAEYGIKSVAFPGLGCGNGGLSWNVVGPLMYHKLRKLPIEIEIYAPYGTKQEELGIDFLSKETDSDDSDSSRMTAINPNWYLLLQAVRDLNQRSYSLNVGRTIYQKICYIMSRNG
ncbi:MAG: macro domain-containing protein, partial [Butyrivibrio sp.]|nr:macro domain-containing protein [Butyrivibrio sp.]